MGDDSIFLINNGGLGFSEPQQTSVQGAFTPSMQSSKCSYKDSLTLGVLGSYINCNSDEETEVPPSATTISTSQSDEVINITLSNSDKERLAKRWAQSLIVKVYGKKVGFKFLSLKLAQLWKLKKFPAIVDLGEDFFLLKFEFENDYHYVLKEGPWFIGGHFLTVRKWEPNFRASEATFSSVAVWVRLNELPVEFFDGDILQKIGRNIGKLIKIDTHTLADERRRYARLCVQINMDKPLAKFIQIEGQKQPITYEGISALCFHSGKIGHKEAQCPDKLPASEPLKMVDQTKEEDCFGPWMVVQSKKSKKMIQGGYQNSNSLQKVTLQEDNDRPKKVNASNKQNVSSKKGNNQIVDFPSDKSVLVNNKRKGKEHMVSKIAPTQKTSWMPKNFEFGQTSALIEKHNLEPKIPFSSSTAFSRENSERNTVPFSIQEMEFLTNLPNSYTDEMGFNHSISHSCFSNSILENCLQNAKSSSSAKSKCQTGTGKSHSSKEDPRSSCSARFESTISPIISVEGIAGLTTTADGAEKVVISRDLLQSAVCLHSSATNSDEPSLDPNPGGGSGELHSSSHYPDGVPDRLGTDNNQVLGKSMEGSKLGDPSLDDDNGEILSSCWSPRIPAGQQQVLGLQNSEQSECKSFPTQDP
ncbi:hypothetical protein COLO4_28420 [Corchorus olitorius]|uniref:DUF4283 domain-containing protein n=1 Tax=Corchorus olitorius TaxID=93759 RepID=A0A1R3HL12_9ROSI|nr:hypothetical protein COLO4_28420 [Corchorus olitorius]